MKADIQGAALLMHGLPKSGKSQTAFSFPGERAWLATEDGHRFIDDKHIKRLTGRAGWAGFAGVANPETGKNLYDWLEEVKPMTVIVDTVGNLADWCVEYVCHNHGWSHPEDGGKYGKGWKPIKDEFESALSRFLQWTGQRDITRLFLDHTKVEEVDTTRKSYTRLAVAMPGWAWKALHPELDYIWHLSYDVVEGVSADSLKHVTQNRLMYVSGFEGVQAGTRDPRVVRSHIGGIPKTQQYEYLMEHLYGEQE